MSGNTYATATSLMQQEVEAAGGPCSGGSLSPVRAEDLGFALTLFVAAANQQLNPQQIPGFRAARDCDQFFRVLSVDDRPAMVGPSMSEPKATLRASFNAVWEFYRQDDQRYSICARVLGFYYLMERTQGSALERWVEVCPEDPETVRLQDVVVEALARVPLEREGLLPATLFLEMVEALSKIEAR